MTSASRRRVIAVIPARYGSTRFPGKPLAKIQGKEMVLWVIEGALQAKTVDQVLVATDDERIEDVVTEAGYQVMMTDTHLASGSDRIHAALTNYECEVVVNVQGDEPLISGELIDRLVAPMLLEHQAPEMATLAHPILSEELSSLNSVKVVIDQNQLALYFSRFPIPYSRLEPQGDSASNPFIPGVYKHIGMYAYKRSFLKQFCEAPQSIIEKAESLEQLRALTLGARIKVVLVDQPSWGVDTPQDLARIEELLRKRS